MAALHEPEVAEAPSPVEAIESASVPVPLPVVEAPGRVAPSSPGAVLSLQRAAGNQAVTQALSRAPAEAGSVRRCACGGVIPPGQTECESCRAAGGGGSSGGGSDVLATKASDPNAAIARMLRRDADPSQQR